MCCKNCASKLLLVASVVAGAAYIFKNYELKLVRKKREEKTVDEQVFVPEYVDLASTYVTEYEQDTFSQPEHKPAEAPEEVKEEPADAAEDSTDVYFQKL